ncbi:TetR/AcrR family transcriptional regulator [Pseudonocardia ailaonensis]|uniref:TetR/AcrR family transcriptional regulator n=1 Tax=Pseudonocardia ailaonensis TaxID=367279 RepID=A0ABN2NMU6_9PSEU
MSAPHPGPRVTRRRAETRARLLLAALDVFVDRGVGATSVEQVCEAAGYTRGAFYSNFSSLDELLLTLYEQRSAAVLAALEEALARLTGPAAVGTLTDVVDDLLTAHLADRRWLVMQTEIALHALRTPAAAGEVAARRARLRERVGALIAQAAQRAGRRLTTSPDELASAALALVEGARLQAWLEPGDGPVRTDRLLLTALLEQYTVSA